MAVGFQDFSPLLDSCSKLIEDGHCIVPADAGIGNTDTVLKASLALLGNLLVACCVMRKYVPLW